MIDVSAIRAEMARNGHTIKSLAEILGVAPKTFARMLKNGVMGTDVAEVLIKELHISNPTPIFFKQE